MRMRERKINNINDSWKKWAIRGLKIFSIATITLAVGGLGVAMGFVASIAKNEKVRTKADYDRLLSKSNGNSTIYFAGDGKDDQVVGKMLEDGVHKQSIKSLNDVSDYLTKAFIAIEDHDFYSHSGISYTGTARAFLQDLTNSPVRTGGSTITQQLVKNEILETSIRTRDRKIREWINAIRIEKYYTKEEIFVKYLNSVEYGRGANGRQMTGVVSGARYLFNKEVKDLSLAQAAYLAGMVKGQNNYNPFAEGKDRDENIKRGIERMKLVLNNMLELEFITEAEYNEALKFDIANSFAKPSDFISDNAYSKYPMITAAVEEEAIDIFKELYKDDPDFKNLPTNKLRSMIKMGGYKIETTIDKNLYEEMNKAIKKLYFGTSYYKGTAFKERVGATLIDNRTGGILAFVSSNEPEVTSPESHSEDVDTSNYALEVTKQPGSAMKPILVYGPAMNEGYISADSIIVDEPIKKEAGGTYQNADKKYKGSITITDALKWSRNPPAIKLFKKLGAERAFSYIRKMGLEPHEYDGETLALGGATEGFTVSDMSASYSMFANNGLFRKAHIINRIITNDGQVIYDAQQKIQPVRVLKPEVAYEMTKMMRKVVTEGTATMINGYAAGYNVAGKTGTTTSNNDSYFVGYTPEITLGVWGGYKVNLTTRESISKEAWGLLFQAMVKTKPNLVEKGKDFKDPGGKVATQCFECNRHVPSDDEKEKDKKKKKGEAAEERKTRKERRTRDSDSDERGPRPNEGSDRGDSGGGETNTPPRNGGGGGNGSGNGGEGSGGGSEGDSGEGSGQN
jgi:penicillin-binding protein